VHLRVGVSDVDPPIATVLGMTQSPDHETRITRLEVRMEEVATDAAVARHLAAANDRDHGDLAVKVDANRKAINALGEQTRARFDQVDARFEQVDARFEQLKMEMRAGFAEVRADIAELRTGHDDLRAAMRHGFDQSAAGFARIAELITARDDDR
jgi:hypothetical protein